MITHKIRTGITSITFSHSFIVAYTELNKQEATKFWVIIHRNIEIQVTYYVFSWTYNSTHSFMAQNKHTIWIHCSHCYSWQTAQDNLHNDISFRISYHLAQQFKTDTYSHHQYCVT